MLMVQIGTIFLGCVFCAGKEKSHIGNVKSTPTKQQKKLLANMNVNIPHEKET
jgi:hypothetical protein